jgi:hypothetical protein
MCASTETDVRESGNDCTLASGEGLGSGGETSHPMSLKRPFPHPGNALYLAHMYVMYLEGAVWNQWTYFHKTLFR